MTELLKAYQEEIDQLTRRCKFSETSFSSLYKSLYEAPDPQGALEFLITMVTSGSTHQLEIERLKGEIQQYDEEFQRLKNQDITIRRLEDSLQEYRDKIEEKIAEEVNKRSEEFEERADRRIKEVMELQKAAERRLAAAVESMKQAQASADRAQTQLFEASAQSESRLSALLADNAILAEGSERAHAKVAELEGELQLLKSSHGSANQIVNTSGAVGSAGSGNGSGLTSNLAASEEVKTLQIVIDDLRQEIRRKEDAARSEKQRLESTIRDLNQQLTRERDLLSRTKQELTERPTKEDLMSVRRQLKVLQRVVFSVEADDDIDNDESTHDPENAVGEKFQLETLLTTRIKALESELSDARRKLSDAQEQQAATAELLASTTKALEVSKALNANLEADLESLQRGDDKSNSMSGKGNSSSGSKQDMKPYGGGNNTGTSMGGGGSGDVGGRNGTMDLSELLGVDMLPSTTKDTRLNSGKQIGSLNADTDKEDIGGGASSNMVKILQSQRDRYKERLSQAEQLVVGLQQQIQVSQGAKAQLESDNLALYAKIRYLQSYNYQKDGSGGSSSAIGHHISPKPMRISNSKAAFGGRVGNDIRKGLFDAGQDEEMGDPSRKSRNTASRGILGDFELDDDEDTESRYHSLYEQRMNPFAEFSEVERRRKLQELTVSDRIILNTVLAVISSQAGRSFLVIYMGTMHLLVFAVLYYNSHHVNYTVCDPQASIH